MKTQSILVYFPGYPFRLDMLLPDRELAVVARALLEHGNVTGIYDYGALEMFDRQYPGELRSLAERLADCISGGASPVRAGKRFISRRLCDLWRLRDADRVFLYRRESVCDDIARGLVSKKRLDFVCFKLVDGDNLRVTLSIVRRLREWRPEVRVGGFGLLTEHFGQALLNQTDAFDFLCVRDIESSVVRVAERIKEPMAWASLPGVLCNASKGGRPAKPSRWEGNARSAPTYELGAYPTLRGSSKLRLFVLEESGGCSRRGRTAEDASYVRAKAARAVCDEMAEIRSVYGARAFHVEGHGSSGTDVARELLARGWNVVYSRSGGIRCSAPGAMETLRASGCEAASFQVDTGSQRLLEGYYERDFGVTDIERILGACKRAGMFTVARMTYPCGADDRHTWAETLRLLDRTSPDAAPVSLPEFVPGSRWFSDPQRFGFQVDMERYAARALTCRAPFLGDCWQWAFPGRVGGRSAAEVMRENAAMARTIEGRGIVPNLNEWMALIARVLGHRGQESTFIRGVERQFATGDFCGLAAVAASFNEKACVPGNMVAFGTQPYIRAAVGN